MRERMALHEVRLQELVGESNITQDMSVRVVNELKFPGNITILEYKFTNLQCKLHHLSTYDVKS